MNEPNNIDLEALKKLAEQESKKTEETPVVGSEWWSGDTKDEEPIENNSMPVENNQDTDDYDGPGLVMDNSTNVEPEPMPTYTGITPMTQESVDKYLAEMDAEIEKAKEAEAKYKEEHPSNDSDEDDEEESNAMTKDEFAEKYEKAVVVIDKTGFGKVIDFTDEEHEKLEKSKTIRLEEVETISLDTIKTKKIKKKSEVDKIIKRVTNFNTTNIVLPASGYTAVVKGCSAYELIPLIDQNKNALLDAQNKWSLIHSKIESTSLGNMDFNTFLLNTAAQDYNTFIYGLLCSTYPDDDTIPLTCEKCESTFDHEYSVKSLIRVESMSEGLQQNIMKICDASVSETLAKKVHDESPISQVKRVKLPISGHIVELYVQSAYDLINKSLKDLTENKDSKYNTAAIISTAIRTIYVKDPTDTDDSYYEVDNAMDIVKIVYTLKEKDVLIIRKLGEGLLEDSIINYGFMNVTCPKCKHYTSTVNMELENILFYRYRQALNTTIE